MHNSPRKTLHRGIFAPLLILAIVSFAPFTNALPLTSLPPGRQMLPPSGLDAYSLFGKQPQLAKIRVVDVSDASFSRALRVESSGGAPEEFSVSIVAPVVSSVKIGDVLLAHFWLRCDNSMTGEGYTTFAFEINHPQFSKSAQFKISSGKNWKEVFVPFVAARDYPVGTARITFWAGYDRQTIELGGIEVIDFESRVKRDDLPETKVTYDGRDPNAQWRKDALARIEKIRKGDLAVYVTDSAGSPLNGAQVHARLRHGAFGFGTCVDTDLILSDSPDAVRYRQTILSLFNRAVFENDMKWQATWNGVPPSVDRAMAWLRENNIPVRGHNLVWGSWLNLPFELRKYEKDPEKLREITAKHITDEVSHFRGQLVDWDVVNEPYTNFDLIDLLGGRKIMIDWYNLAHQADPDSRLFLNDFGILDGGKFSDHRENFYDNIKFLKDSGAPIGGIGIQSHFGTDLPAPANILKIFDRFATLDLPIESTELSLALHDDQLQADYLRDYMIAAFSHPAVQDIMLWGFWQKRHWRPEGGIFTDDWTMRAAARVWNDLVTKRWSTDESASTDSSGQADIRGFLGSYDVTVTAAGKTKTVTTQLSSAGSRLIVQIE